MQDSKMDVKQIARESEVSYDILVRWTRSMDRGEPCKIDLDAASRIHEFLTGEPLLEADEA